MTVAAARRVRIEGRVQGVWFRAWTAEQAAARGLRGWVRNRRDGSVEALFAGTGTQVQEMVRLCWDGPPDAAVAEVIDEPAQPPAEAGFRQLPTG